MELVQPWRRVLSPLVCTALLAASALRVDAATSVGDSVKTRFGSVEVRSEGDSTTIVHRGKRVLSLADQRAAVYRITPKHANRDFVLLQGWQPGLNCRHFYRVLALSKGQAQVSAQFGDCQDMAGAGFIGQDPVIHLRNTASDARKGRPLITSYLLKLGQISEVFSSTNPCNIADFVARTNVDLSGATRRDERRVAGVGRVYLSSAPSEGCLLKEQFVSPGDQLVVTLDADGFRFAYYRDPRTGKQIEGWVPSKRLEKPQ
ncbi:MAG TPA: hypothetical protein VGC21_04860 [Telluria sp.]